MLKAEVAERVRRLDLARAEVGCGEGGVGAWCPDHLARLCKDIFAPLCAWLHLGLREFHYGVIVSNLRVSRTTVGARVCAGARPGGRRKWWGGVGLGRGLVLPVPEAPGLAL